MTVLIIIFYTFTEIKFHNFSSRIFMELDINGDGELTCEEFVKGCMQDDSLVRVLQSGGLNPEEADQDD